VLQPCRAGTQQEGKVGIAWTMSDGCQSCLLALADCMGNVLTPKRGKLMLVAVAQTLYQRNGIGVATGKGSQVL